MIYLLLTYQYKIMVLLSFSKQQQQQQQVYFKLNIAYKACARN